MRRSDGKRGPGNGQRRSAAPRRQAIKDTDMIMIHAGMCAVCGRTHKASPPHSQQSVSVRRTVLSSTMAGTVISESCQCFEAVLPVSLAPARINVCTRDGYSIIPTLPFRFK